MGAAARRGRRDHHNRVGEGCLRSVRDGVLRVRDGVCEPARRERLHWHLDADRARRLVKQGETFELRVTPDPYVTVRYAGASGDFNPIHIDEDFARQVGLPGRILHGLWTMAQVARAHTDAAGGPEHLKYLKVEFRGMGVMGEEIMVKGTV